MSRKGTMYVAALAAFFGAGLVLAQDRPRDARDEKPVENEKPLEKEKPLVASGGKSDLKGQCETALRTKDYLKDLKITFREEGEGRIVCEGTVPTKVHACALFLTCMSVHGVGQVDTSRLRIEHWGSETTLPKKTTAGDEAAEKAKSEKALSLYAVVLNPADKATTTVPAGARAFKSDVIVIGDVPMSALPDKRGAGNREFPEGNADNVPKNDKTLPDQPVAPHNPGAYPNPGPAPEGGRPR